MLDGPLSCYCPGDRAVVLGNQGGQALKVLARHPARDEPDHAWLAQAVSLAGEAHSTGAVQTRPLSSGDELYGQPTGRHLVAVPVRDAGQEALVVVLTVAADGADALALARERLSGIAPALRLCRAEHELQRRQSSLQRLQRAVDVLSAVGGQERFAAAAMAFCNQLALGFNAGRVSLGVSRRRYVHLVATNHAERITPKMRNVRDLEAAMEECLDQDLEIVFPPEPTAVCISRCAAQLSARHGPAAIASLPLRKAGAPLAAVTLERQADRPFTTEELACLRLACELCAPALLRMYQSDRWLGARAAARLGGGLAGLPQPRYTAGKLLAALLLAAAAFLAFAKGTYTVKAPVVVQAQLKRSVPAPFKGTLKSVNVSPGKSVAVGDPLAVMDDKELSTQLRIAQAEQAGALKRVSIAVGKNEMAQAEQAQAEADQAEARMQLIQGRINQAAILAPCRGTVISGDLKPREGGPVERGEVLFEIAPLEELEVELAVEEGLIADIAPGQQGELATVSYPRHRIGFMVDSIHPVAEVVDKKNVFKVRGTLLDRPDWLRPGMEGQARVEIGQRHLAWIWTHRFLDWVRVQFW